MSGVSKRQAPSELADTKATNLARGRRDSNDQWIPRRDELSSVHALIRSGVAALGSLVYGHCGRELTIA
jgi:hypothetical protein